MGSNDHLIKTNTNARDWIKTEEVRKKPNVEEVINDIQNYQLKWNQHVLVCQKLEYHEITAVSTTRKKRFTKTFPSFEKSVHVVAERELNPKLRMEEEEEEEEAFSVLSFP